jgi:ADP-heptose:LPS heptosyltransferase
MTSLPKSVLVWRFSAFGDVAMTAPIIDTVARAYPETIFTVVSRSAWSALFAYMPMNVRFVPVDFATTHRGILGLSRLYKQLRQLRPDAIADLHDVLRTQYLRLRFRLVGIPVATLDKGRRDRRRLTRTRHKRLRLLKNMFERYADVFRALGFTIEPTFASLFPATARLSTAFGEKGMQQWVGIAPFAKHRGKCYPTERMFQVATALAERPQVKVFLFGASGNERELLRRWAVRCPSLVVVGDSVNDLSAELSLMSALDVMVSMDSANMHLASVVGVPVVSVWGATHPYIGYMGWNQRDDDAVQVALPCRPCSAFGKRPCYKGDYECMSRITPAQILDKVNRYVAL